MSNSASPAATTMPRTISSLSWFRAFQILPALALNTMYQPAGRVLGASPYNGAWLRASPFICALDAVAIVVRSLAYCALLPGAPRNVLFAIRRDRFDEFKSSHDQETIFETMPRLLEFMMSTWPLVYAWGSRGEIKWTMAWAWMYLAPFVVLEVIMELTRHLRLEAPKATSDIELQITVSAADFELEASAADEDYEDDDEAPLIKRTKDTTDGASDVAMESTRTKYASSETDIRKKDITDDNSSTAIQGQSSGPAGRDGEDDNDSSAPLFQEQSTKSAIRAGATDLEAANGSQDDNPLMLARFLRFKIFLDYCDTALLGIGCILHVIFIYWAFLDFIHPYLGNSIRSTSTWSFPIHLVSMPMTVLVLFTIMALGFFVMFLLYLLVYGLGAGFYAIGKPLWFSFQAFVRGWMDRHPTVQNIVAIVSTTVSRWAQKAMATLLALMDRNSFIFAIVMIVTVGPCLLALFLVWSTITVFIAQFLWSEYMIWVYELVSAEFVVLLIFGLICFVVRGWLKRVVKRVFPRDERFEASLYLDEMGVTLLTGVLISFAVLTLSYGFRYPYFEVGKWRDNWQGYLDF
ncbi:hypothetical protein VF21_03394 [Pseudogymnoascus sp. 05NY08]|nr:hypothetical protein VF21_03394 [Pseudogymnoascus sp. 05NY08]